MKVSELIAILSEQDPDAIAIVSSDAEGNHYSPVSSVGEMGYVADTPYSGETYIWELDHDLVEAGFTEEDTHPDAVKALVIYPTN